MQLPQTYTERILRSHEECEEELEALEGAYEAEAEEGLIGEAASSVHYSALADRLFSSVRDAAQESKPPSTLTSYRRYFTAKSEISS
jgi:hypothetical protein